MFKLKLLVSMHTPWECPQQLAVPPPAPHPVRESCRLIYAVCTAYTNLPSNLSATTGPQTFAKIRPEKFSKEQCCLLRIINALYIADAVCYTRNRLFLMNSPRRKEDLEILKRKKLQREEKQKWRKVELFSVHGAFAIVTIVDLVVTGRICMVFNMKRKYKLRKKAIACVDRI